MRTIIFETPLIIYKKIRVSYMAYITRLTCYLV